MNFRQTNLLDAEAINTAGTRTLDLTIKDKITRLNFQVKATNNGSTPTAHPATIITTLQVVDGSDVLWSLSGKEALALAFYEQKRTPFCTNNYLNDVQNITHFQMNFGRHLYDRDYALDPAKFRNPQIKITHNLAAGGSAPDAATLDVVADVFDDLMVEPKGFLSAKELRSFTLSASANEYVDLPVDYTMRTILVMSHYTGKMPHEQIQKITLDQDNKKRIPFDDRTSDLMKYLAANFPELQEYIVGATGATAVNHFVMATYEIIAAVTPSGNATTAHGSDLAYGGTVPVIGAAGVNFHAMVRGMAPFGAVPLFFGRPQNPEDWQTMNGIGSWQLTLQAGASPGASSTCQVVTQQLRPYAATK